MTLETILKRIGSYVDQDSSVPQDSDLEIRTNFVNEAYEEWARMYDFDELRNTYLYQPSIDSCVTVPLPSTYMKMQSPINIAGTEYREVKSGDDYDMTDEIFWITGNMRDGFNAIVPKGIASGVSALMQIQSFPTSLATLSDVPVMMDANYLVQKGISKVWMNRGDPRFQMMDEEAARTLSNLIENQNAKRSRSGENRISDYYTKRGYRIGRR